MLQLFGGDAVRPVALRPDGVLALLLGASCAVALACGGSQTKTAAAPATAPGREGAGDPHAEIEALDHQITDELARAQLPAPPATCSGPACAQAMSQPFAVPSIGDAQCRPPASGTRCDDVCTLSTGICTNQRRICELAGQLPGDDWAAGKCESARASCKVARERCCSCTP